MFWDVLNEVRLGVRSEDTETYIQSLERYLSACSSEPVHIFFRKLPALMFNLLALQRLPGQFLKYVSIDENNTSNISCPADEIIMMKPGCKVMHLWNTSNELHNGTLGVFLGAAQGNALKVLFPGIGTRMINRETWLKKDREGTIVGKRMQYPLALAYAITCHKSQGMTLDAAVVHGSDEFVPGLYYVAMSRVRSPQNLQVLGFNKKHITKPGESLEMRINFVDYANVNEGGRTVFFLFLTFFALKICSNTINSRVPIWICYYVNQH